MSQTQRAWCLKHIKFTIPIIKVSGSGKFGSADNTWAPEYEHLYERKPAGCFAQRGSRGFVAGYKQRTKTILLFLLHPIRARMPLTCKYVHTCDEQKEVKKHKYNTITYLLNLPILLKNMTMTTTNMIKFAEYVCLHLDYVTISLIALIEILHCYGKYSRLHPNWLQLKNLSPM
jgi:hypothetical protein